MYSNSQSNTNRNNSLSSLKGLTCEICFEAYNHNTQKPLSLPCGHTFCSFCLKSFQSRCPTCRTSFQESQVQRNYALLSLLDDLGREEEKCSVHKREVDRFCKSCMKLMCSVCHCQHIGSATIISDVNLRDEIKEIQKSLRETQSQENALREKINMGLQIKIKEVENEETRLREEAQIALELKTFQIRCEEDELVLQAEEDAKRKIKLIEEEKQKVIDEIKKGTSVKIEASETRHKISLEIILSKKMKMLSPIEARNSELLQKMQVFDDLKQDKCETLAECANLYQLWEQKKSQVTEILTLNDISAEFLFAKIHDIYQKIVVVQRDKGDKKPSEEQAKGFSALKYTQDYYMNHLRESKLQVGELVDFDQNGEWVNARIIGKEQNAIGVIYSHKGLLDTEEVAIGFGKLLKRWKKGDEFQINNLIDVINTVEEWCVARVMKVLEDKILIHYEGRPEKCDEWLPKNSGSSELRRQCLKLLERIAEFGTFTPQRKF